MNSYEGSCAVGDMHLQFLWILPNCPPQRIYRGHVQCKRKFEGRREGKEIRTAGWSLSHRDTSEVTSERQSEGGSDWEEPSNQLSKRERRQTTWQST